MKNRDFWVFAQADLDSDRLVKNISMNFGSAITFKEQSLYHELFCCIDDDRRRSIMRELAETLDGQISQIKFDPAINHGVPRLTKVVVSTHFHSSNDASNRWEVETSIEPGFDSRDTRVMGGHRIDVSFH
jgi:hypothetical protein